ncbi:OpgC protein OS=Tsukamurella paurometabola (strain ATCC 8368 / DSM / CCUG 35730 / CIP 100753/ JCM 10117 / KCTC 9821 / NBRC 16120 / NCIMB 702349 / NCTC 13040) OX=521096 GN=Tpau_0075 PE=4 SV=1 [Tsukamurella paurometabola]|nr:OpgC protein [Tsukamurella paurometabola]
MDAARGLAVFSMITGHFDEGAFLSWPTHEIPYFDGASAFVLLSGLILGVVHRRWVDRDGGCSTSRERLARRITVIYVCQVLLSGLAAIVSLVWPPATHLGLRPIHETSHPVLDIVTLRYLPAGGDVLALYFVLMCAALILIPVLRKGWWKPILVFSLALYIWAMLQPPAWFLLPNENAAGATADWCAWQALFVPALVVGWKWHDWRVSEVMVKSRVVVVLLLGTAAVFVGGRAVSRTPAADMLGAKIEFGPARVIAAWVVLPAVIAVVTLLLRYPWFRRASHPFVVVGTRSLDSYVLQALLLMTLPVVVIQPWGPGPATGITLAVLVLCWAWAEFRTWAGWAKLHRIPSRFAHRSRRHRSLVGFER